MNPQDFVQNIQSDTLICKACKSEFKVNEKVCAANPRDFLTNSNELIHLDCKSKLHEYQITYKHSCKVEHIRDIAGSDKKYYVFSWIQEQQCLEAQKKRENTFKAEIDGFKNWIGDPKRRKQNMQSYQFLFVLLFIFLFISIIMIGVLFINQKEPTPKLMAYPPKKILTKPEEMPNKPSSQKKSSAVIKTNPVIDYFRTKKTASGEGDTWGFESDLNSNLVAFEQEGAQKWLSARNDHVLIAKTFHKPGGWEKFKLEKKENYYYLKSAHNKYVVCEENGQANANRDNAVTWERIQFIEVEQGKAVLYNPFFKKYFRVDGDNVRCDTTDKNKATVWSSPTKSFVSLLNFSVKAFDISDQLDQVQGDTVDFKFDINEKGCVDSSTLKQFEDDQIRSIDLQLNEFDFSNVATKVAKDTMTEGRIVNRKSPNDNICLGAVDQNPKPGTTMKLLNSGPNGCQIWQYTKSGDFIHKSSGLCVGLDGEHNGANPILQKCNQQNIMRWNFEFIEGKFFQIVNKKNKKCYNLDGSDGSVGRKGELWGCRRKNGKGEPSDNMEWKWGQKDETKGFDLDNWLFSLPKDSISDYPIDAQIINVVNGQLRAARSYEQTELKTKSMCFDEANKAFEFKAQMKKMTDVQFQFSSDVQIRALKTGSKSNDQTGQAIYNKIKDYISKSASPQVTILNDHVAMKLSGTIKFDHFYYKNIQLTQSAI